ncbi:class I SAM-dependent methyltransferase [Streptomyces radiopugnans]|uniref:Methyltransferase domain-containing protein n=1 Tax=Streptomyces radiopugnans TaxID=403935 RepID=A0A1H9DEE5_9ACTN|nr:class I SAM-dependent methyltransferase [Streptomyces radiopugnans]SEQ11850.1 Methyltransferase domain-containing protein [Streptomyces radiopugnans]
MTDTSSAIAGYWNAAEPSFDDEPDHGLRAGRTRRAWARRLRAWAPPAPAEVLDVGCGTGSLSLLLAEAGHRVTGVDLAPAMIGQARAKLAAAGHAATFTVGDAAAPPTGERTFGMVLARHLLWILPDPHTALRRWTGRLRPGGRLVLVEGRWRESGRSDTPYVAGAGTLPRHGGIGADDLAGALRPLVADPRVEHLGNDPDLWGRTVDDERYALVARV